MMNKGDAGQTEVPSTTSQTQTKEIPAWAQGSAQDLLSRGHALSYQPYQSYQGQRIAEMTSQQNQGLSQIQNRAVNGSPEENAARQNYTDTMSGKYLSPGSNPYLQATVQQGMDDVSGKINSQFGGSNYGTTAHQETLTRNLGQVANDAYGQNYVNERNNQMKQSALLPQYQNIDYNNAQQLTGVGDIYRQESQDVLNNKYSDWAAAQNQPYRQLDVLGNALGAAVNGQGSVQSSGYQSNPYTANRYASAIGGGLAGYGLGSSIGGEGSYGGAIGAGLGGLLGYMGS
jgi:hypothetical protein